MNDEKNKQKLGHKCKKHIPHEHKKNWNRAVARFQFFVAIKKGDNMFCPSLAYFGAPTIAR